MPAKNARKVYFLVCLSLVFVFFAGCGIKGERFTNKAPRVEITSQTGFTEEELKDPLKYIPEHLREKNKDGEWVPLPAAFQQKMEWAGYDEDGVIKHYAYRILDAKGNPIETPGNDYIATGDHAVLVPQDLIEKLAHEGISPIDGWVIHYQDGADQSLSLYDPEARRSIWTNASVTSALVNLPAHNGEGHDSKYGSLDTLFVTVSGVPIHGKASFFEVVAIDNQGLISNVAKRSLFTKSVKPSLLVSSSAGQLAPTEDGIGQGIRVIFAIADTTVNLTPVQPHYFIYRIRHIEKNVTDSLGTRPDAVSAVNKGYTQREWYNKWFSTRGSAKIDEVVLTSVYDPITALTPPLMSNFDGNDKVSETLLEVKAVEYAGIASESAFVRFSVTDKYRPDTMFYLKNTYALGTYHYVSPTSPDINGKTDVPYNAGRNATMLTPEPILSATGEIEGFEWSIVGDVLTRFWFKWGYPGEYTSNDPTLKRIATLQADSLRVPYGSEVTYFHIQLNGKAYYYGPLTAGPNADKEQKYTYDDNYINPDDPEDNTQNFKDKWLRVPASHELGQKLVINGFDRNNELYLDGTQNVIKVRTEDLQGAIDPTPAILRFKINPLNTNRSGVLYINANDGEHIENFSDNIKEFYSDVIPSNIPFTYINRFDVIESITNNSQFDIRLKRNLFPFSYLQKFKYVIYATDSFNGGFLQLSFPNDFDDIELYIKNGGNVIIVGNPYIRNLAGAMSTSYPNSLSDYFGFPTNADNVKNSLPPPTYTDQSNARHYLLAALASSNSNINNLNVEIQNNPETGPVANNVKSRGGLHSYAYFDFVEEEDELEQNAESILVFDCKPVNASEMERVAPRNEEIRQMYHGKTIGIKTQLLNNSTNYVFGFPLWHIQKADVADLFNRILTND